MKRAALCVFVALLFVAQPGVGQTRTEERRTTVDVQSGDTLITQSLVVSQSEDITPRNSMIIVNPLKFFLLYNLTYMQRVSPTVVVGAGIQAPTIAGVDGWGLNAEVRFYASRKAPRGFYVAPNVAYNYLHAGSADASPLSIGVLLGWQWFAGEEFALGLGIGADHYTGSVSGGNHDINRFSGTVPVVRFDIGYAW